MIQVVQAPTTLSLQSVAALLTVGFDVAQFLDSSGPFYFQIADQVVLLAVLQSSSKLNSLLGDKKQFSFCRKGVQHCLLKLQCVLRLRELWTLHASWVWALITWCVICWVFTQYQCPQSHIIIYIVMNVDRYRCEAMLKKKVTSVL